MKKFKHVKTNDRAWAQYSIWKQLDLNLSGVLPGWLIGLAVAMFFGALGALGITGVIAFAAWDVSWLWGVTARAIFGGLSLLFTIVLWTNA